MITKYADILGLFKKQEEIADTHTHTHTHTKPITSKLFLYLEKFFVSFDMTERIRLFFVR